MVVEFKSVRNQPSGWGLERSAATNSSSEFSIMGLPIAGSYEVTGSKQRFGDAHADRLRLLGGRSE